MKSGKILTQDDEDEDGRTVVRGAPKIVKRVNKGAGIGRDSQQPPTTLSPAAVIKQTLENARNGKRSEAGLVAGPPVDLLEDDADLHPADAGPQRTAILGQERNGPASMPPSSMNPGSGHPYNSMAMAATQHSMQHGPMSQGPMSSGPMSQPPMSGMMHGPMSMSQPPMSMGPASAAPMSQPPPSSGYPQGYHSMPPHSAVSVPGVAMSASNMPAHFMVPQAPYSDGRMDPPGAAITNRHRVSGRPTTSWAIALLAFGLFVGVGAVAAMQQNGGVMDTTASFVDPARAQQPQGSPVQAAQPPQPVVTAPVVATPPAGQPQPAVTGGVIGASTPPPATAPDAKDAKDAKTAKNEKSEKAEKAEKAPAPKHHWVAPPSPAPQPKAEKAEKPEKPEKPEKKTASNDDDKPAKPTKKASKADDEETRKALEDLKKAQLESASSFGEK